MSPLAQGPENSLPCLQTERPAVRRLANQNGDRDLEMALQQWEGEGGTISES